MVVYEFYWLHEAEAYWIKKSVLNRGKGVERDEKNVITLKEI